MTAPSSAVARRRRVFVPGPVEAPAVPESSPEDPPIYRELLRSWADGGRTLPGRHDPEWTRLATPPGRRPPVSATRDPAGDGR
ncbi:hypothetical protein AB0E65_07675 [Streptomyces fragilis]|uniref:Uncharacterized protein n=1 Tax=Streptomyces fragilis TaxID=67301 RepID=A0ABV2YEC2_9ACTN|nr:hypothetical protein [Streptomyces fragilis]